MGMLEPGRGLDLAEEPFAAQRGAELGVEHLDSDVAVVPHVVREVYRGHAARAQFTLDPVTVGQGSSQALDRVGQQNPEGGQGGE